MSIKCKDLFKIGSKIHDSVSDMRFLRPVLVLGGLSDLIAERLVQDFPYQFGRVALEVMHCSGSMLEKGVAENIFVDYKRKGSHYECITMGAIKEISSKVSRLKYLTVKFFFASDSVLLFIIYVYYFSIVFVYLEIILYSGREHKWN